MSNSIVGTGTLWKEVINDESWIVGKISITSNGTSFIFNVVGIPVGKGRPDEFDITITHEVFEKKPSIEEVIEKKIKSKHKKEEDIL